MQAGRLHFPSEWLVAGKNFPFPDWPTIFNWIEAEFPSEDHAAVLQQLAHEWVCKIVGQMPVPLRVAESKNFIVALPGDQRQASVCLQHLEHYHEEIAAWLKPLALRPRPQKVVVLFAPDPDTFAHYIADYFPDGEFMAPGGVCLNQGYVHFALPDAQLTLSATVLAHELCHVFLTGIGWPLWVEEAVVQTIENKLTGRVPYILDREMVRRHQSFWTPELMQQFWTGESFFRPDDGSELSYHLSRFLLNATTGAGEGALFAFLAAARTEDSGFAAFQEVMGASLCEVLENLLGEGNWSYWKPAAARAAG